MQFDGEEPDKITRGAYACNDDKVIFENPPIYAAAVFRVPGMKVGLNGMGRYVPRSGWAAELKPGG